MKINIAKYQLNMNKFVCFRHDVPAVDWVLPPGISAKQLGGVFHIDWVCKKELSFNCSTQLYNSYNFGKPVKIGRDGQEIEPKVAEELCRLFPEDETIELTPVLKKSKEVAKNLREKGVKIVFRPPPVQHIQPNHNYPPRGGRMMHSRDRGGVSPMMRGPKKLFLKSKHRIQQNMMLHSQRKPYPPHRMLVEIQFIFC